MKIVDLPVEKREKLGSAHARRYRQAGLIPCQLYGGGQENVNLVAKSGDFGNILEAHTAIVRLKLGAEEQTALVRDVSWDTFGEQVEHVDLTRVTMKDEVSIKVPVHVHGVPAGASQGGMTQVVIRDLELLARVDSIPSEIRVDISKLDIDDAIHIEEIEFPKHTRPANDPRDVVVIIQPPRKMEEELPEEEREPGEPIVEGEEPPAEEGEAKPEEGSGE